MTATRGVTLVEVMIVVAMLGIGVGVIGSMERHQRELAVVEWQKEAANQILDYVAEELAVGRSPDKAVISRLQEALPGSRLEVTKQGRTTKVSLRWTRSNREEHSSLMVFTRKGAL